MKQPIRSCCIGAAALAILLAGCLPASRQSTPPGGSNYNGKAPLANDEGDASFYADAFEGHRTASGEPYLGSEFTAAHRTYPFGTVIRVVNTKNGREVVVRINDRGPFKATRLIDLSRRAAEGLMMIGDGVAHVRIEVLKWGS